MLISKRFELPDENKKKQTMKNFFKYLVGSVIFFSACSREKFAEINTDPDLVLVTGVQPKTLFPNAVLAIHTNDFEAYYDINRNIMTWTDYWVRAGGLPAYLASTSNYTAIWTASNRPYRYDNLYTRESTGAGGALVEMRNVISKMSEADKAKFAHINAITYIPMAWAAFYLSDAVGSVIYKEAFQARYTNPPSFTPKYDTQEELYAILESELKASVAVLKTNLPNQELLGTYDLYFHGLANEAQNWARAANSLRLKMAMRMYKRKPTVAKGIIDEVLADNIGPINSRAANWVFKGGSNVANGGNWNTFASLSGPKGMIDFMRNNSDPRIRNFYKKTAVALTEFNAAKAAGQIPATATYDGEYVGRFVGADALNENDKKFYFNNFPGTSKLYASEIQTALFSSAVAQGLVNFPVITYADVCFMRAELAARSITTENAEDWYKKGIEASIRDYNEWGSDAKVTGFQAVSDAEIAAYLNMPAIKYDPAKGVEQVSVQQYINFFKNPSEGWALRRRTGFPSTTGVVMPFDRKLNLGNEIKMPRRWPLAVPSVADFNYANAKAAIEEMQKDPYFGNLTDITGRVWWDMP